MRTKILTLTFALTLTVGAAQAQVTPQAVIANAPSLPTPEQWAANKGHTEAFKAKISELTGKLNEIQSAEMQTALQDASRRSQTPPPTQAQVQRNQRRTVAAAKDDYAQQQAMMSQLGITQAEMQSMAKMSQKQIEEFMRKRMAEKGIDPAQFATGSDWEAENRRDKQAMEQGQAQIAKQQAMETYMEQMRVTSSKIGEAEQNARTRVAAIPQPDLDYKIGPEEVMRGTFTREQLEAQERRNEELTNAYAASRYQIWHEYIVTTQGHLKFLMPYAQAVDTNTAASVAQQYLEVTMSEPQISL